MRDWSESWRPIALVVACCLIFSSVLGVGLALILNLPGFTIPKINIDFTRFNFAFPWQKVIVEEVFPSEPPRAVSDSVLTGNWRLPDAEVIEIAKLYLGVPYEYAGELAVSGTMDCSAFTVLVYKELGINLPRTSFGQVLLGVEVESFEDMLPGDLLFFQDTWPNDFQTGVTHVGIYVGDRKMIHSSARFGEVVVTPLDDPFYTAHWHSARRIIE